MLTFVEELTFLRYKLLVNACTLFIGLVGNAIVCIVIVCSRSLHTLTDFYLLNLSISDLLILITKFLFDLYYYRSLAVLEPWQRNTAEIYVFNNKAAHYTDFWILFTSWYVSVFTLTAFTVERYVAICHPFFAQSMSKKSRVKKIIFTIWSLGALFALVEVTIRVLKEETRDQNSVHLLDWAESALHCLCLAMPNLAITVMCVLIGRELKRSSTKRPTTLQSNSNHEKALKMFAIIIVVSFLSWAPFFTMLLLICLSPDADEDWSNVLFIVACVANITYSLPSILNPVIYTIMSRKFREALKDLSSKTLKGLDRRPPVFISTQTHETNL